MRKLFFFLLAIAFTGCFTKQSYMTKERFDDITIGTGAAQVQTIAGEPMQVTELSNGDVEYLYVEKIQMGQSTVMENHYILVISNGIVISKRVTTQNPPAYNLIYQNDPNFSQY